MNCPGRKKGKKISPFSQVKPLYHSPHRRSSPFLPFREKKFPFPRECDILFLNQRTASRRGGLYGRPEPGSDSRWGPMVPPVGGRCPYRPDRRQAACAGSRWYKQHPATMQPGGRGRFAAGVDVGIDPYESALGGGASDAAVRHWADMQSAPTIGLHPQRSAYCLAHRGRRTRHARSCGAKRISSFLILHSSLFYYKGEPYENHGH